MKRIRIERVATLLLVCLVIVVFFYTVISGFVGLFTSSEKGKKEPTVSNFVVTGDTTLYDSVNINASVLDGYDYTIILEHIKSELKGDFTFTNLDTVIGNDDLEYTGYPIFNSPTKVVGDLISNGFNMFSLANNQTLDQGRVGAQNALNYFGESYPTMIYSGIKKNCDDDGIVTFKDGNLNYAYIALTTSVENNPADDGCIVNIVDENLEDTLKTLNEAGDIGIVSLHYGKENSQEVSEEEQVLIDKLIDNGVEIVLGHNPRVLRKIEEVKNSDGNDAVIFYSLGNFMHSQVDDINRVGGIAKFDVKKKGKKVVIENVKFIPTFMEYRQGEDKKLMSRHNLRVVKLDKVSELYDETYEEKLMTYVMNVIDKKYLE